MSAKKPSVVGNMIVMIFPIAMIGGGLFLYMRVAKQKELGKSSQNWPTVQGRVLESSVDCHRRSGSERSGSGTEYTPKVNYSYSVDGRKYEGDRLAVGHLGVDFQSHAKDVVMDYPKGKKITIYYMPADPSVSILEPGTQYVSSGLQLFGVVLIILGTGLAFLLIKGAIMMIKTKQEDMPTKLEQYEALPTFMKNMMEKPSPGKKEIGKSPPEHDGF